jgi:hypothetical protein
MLMHVSNQVEGRHPHGHIAMSRAVYEQVDGWPNTAEPSYDFQLIARLRRTGAPSDPGQFGPTQHYFRWQSSGEPHGQSYIRSNSDIDWLARAQAAILAKHGPVTAQPPLVPCLDDESASIISESFSNPCGLTVSYGKDYESSKDITWQIYSLCSSSNVAREWLLPPNDVSRAQLFGDPSPNVIKKIYARSSNGSIQSELIVIESWQAAKFLLRDGRLVIECFDSREEASRSLKSRYYRACETPSDINQHLPLLLGYSKQCKSIVECGVRFITSSYSFAVGLEGKPDAHLSLIDPYRSPYIDEFISICRSAGIEASFLPESDLKCPLIEADMLFIDTWHVYGQLRRELERWHSFVRKYIILHDTTTDALYGESLRTGLDIAAQSAASGIPEDEISKGLWPAVEEFLLKNSDWSLDLRLENNNGISVLKRVQA